MNDDDNEGNIDDDDGASIDDDDWVSMLAEGVKVVVSFYDKLAAHLNLRPAERPLLVVTSAEVENFEGSLHMVLANMQEESAVFYQKEDHLVLIRLMRVFDTIIQERVLFFYLVPPALAGLLPGSSPPPLSDGIGHSVGDLIVGGDSLSLSEGVTATTPPEEERTLRERDTKWPCRIMSNLAYGIWCCCANPSAIDIQNAVRDAVIAYEGGVVLAFNRLLLSEDDSLDDLMGQTSVHNASCALFTLSRSPRNRIKLINLNVPRICAELLSRPLPHSNEHADPDWGQPEESFPSHHFFAALTIANLMGRPVQWTPARHSICHPRVRHSVMLMLLANHVVPLIQESSMNNKPSNTKPSLLALLPNNLVVMICSYLPDGFSDLVTLKTVSEFKLVEKLTDCISIAVKRPGKEVFGAVWHFSFGQTALDALCAAVFRLGSEESQLQRLRQSGITAILLKLVSTDYSPRVVIEASRALLMLLEGVLDDEHLTCSFVAWNERLADPLFLTLSQVCINACIVRDQTSMCGHEMASGSTPDINETGTSKSASNYMLSLEDTRYVWACIYIGEDETLRSCRACSNYTSPCLHIFANVVPAFHFRAHTSNIHTPPRTKLSSIEILRKAKHLVDRLIENNLQTLYIEKSPAVRITTPHFSL
jgi:hypothetical protein